MGVVGRTRWRVLSIDPTTNGFAYAIMEGSESLIDWGRASGKSAEGFRARLGRLCDRYSPNILACEGELGSKRGPQARERIVMAADVAATRQIATCKVSRSDVQALFGVKTKHEVASSLTRHFPEELLHRLPRMRCFDAPEDDRMNVFDAISFALVVLGKL